MPLKNHLDVIEPELDKISHNDMSSRPPSRATPAKRKPSPKKKVVPVPVASPESESDIEEPILAVMKKLPNAAAFHENEEEENLDVSDYLIPCDTCGRKFMEDRLVICSRLISGAS